MIFTVVLVMLVGIFSLLRWSYLALGMVRLDWCKDRAVAVCFACLAVFSAAIPTAAVICLVDIGGGL